MDSPIIEKANGSTDHLTNTDLLEMKKRLDDELHNLQVAHSAVNQDSQPCDIEELETRVHELQHQLLEESNIHSTQELLLKRIQASRTLHDSIFRENTDMGNNLYIERSLEKLELTSEIINIYKETLELQEKLNSQKLANLQLHKENTEMIQKLQTSRDKVHAIFGQVIHTKNYISLKKELEVKCMSLTIYQHVIQLLSVGIGQDWKCQPDFSQLLPECGQSLKLI
uniref:Centromere protein H C-terminal domain-containing protein n=1 Tax=Arion vulgaris TaxID=1028688 RepID=A0A0B7BLU1_9EUPU